MKKKKKIIITVIAAITIFTTAAMIYSNSYINVEDITYSGSDVPESFDGVKIAHLSDYHNHGGKYDDRLIEKIETAEPDYIFLTGDQADRFLTDVDKANAFISRVSEIAPCYLVWGNHDKGLDAKDSNRMNDFAVNCGVTVLDGETVNIERNGQYITVTGTYNYPEDIKSYSERTDEDGFNIWLHHFPEDFEVIADTTRQENYQMDLMFSGHAHGGLIRFPFVNGLFAPGQGFFPKYTSGLYEYSGSSMIVSRGLGNSSWTKRLFDPFHLIFCTIKKSD